MRAGVTLTRRPGQAGRGRRGNRVASMISKWLGPLALLAALVIGDQIRINRPGHKYRLTVEVQTPDGIKSASGVMAVVPDRGYSPGRGAPPPGGAVVARLRGRPAPP